MILKSSVQKIVLSFFIWGLLVTSFVISLKYGFFKKEWNDIIYFMQLVADGCIAIFGYLAYKKRAKDNTRTFYFLIFLSLIPGLFANEIYNLLINIIQINRSGTESMYWSVAYTFFLSIQIYAWYYLFQNKAKKYKNHKWLTIYPYCISAGIIFISLIFILFINEVYVRINFPRALNSLLEIILFSLISICLSRAKNKSLICLDIGFLLLIGFNFAHRFSDVFSIYYKIFDIAWMICLIVILYGLYFSLKEARKEIYFYEENSIHVLTSGAFILLGDLILIVFVFSAIGFSAFQLDKISNYKILMLDVPSAFIFSYSCTLLLSKFFTWRLSLPLGNLIHKIQKITENKTNTTSYGNQIKINEIEVFEEFIIKTVSDLHHANAVKSKFLMNMSHDFRTPASGILYMSRLIHDRLPDDKTKRLQKMVVNSSEQLMTFLDDILDFSGLEHSRIMVKNTYFDIVALINELINFVSVKVYEKNLIINATYAESKRICYFDKSLIRKVILNLLSNAIKFTHFGEINVSVSFSNEHHEFIVISIKDTGIGIDEIYHKKIFEPFYSVEGADSSKYPGIGLGLSNVNLMVEKLNGQITLKSALGSGSEFNVYLPL